MQAFPGRNKGRLSLDHSTIPPSPGQQHSHSFHSWAWFMADLGCPGSFHKKSLSLLSLIKHFLMTQWRMTHDFVYPEDVTVEMLRDSFGIMCTFFCFSFRSLRVTRDWATSLSLFTFCTGEGNGNPLQCSCLENPRDGGAWRAAVYGVAQSWIRLKWLSSSSSSMDSSWKK